MEELGSLIQLGGAGAPLKPTAQKRAQGTLRPDRENKLEPKLEAIAIADPPEELTAVEASAWRRLAAILNPLTIVTAADMEAFRQLVTEIAICDAARDSLFSGGGIIEVTFTAAGGKKYIKRPELEIINQHQKLVWNGLARFGLTPADRQRVTSLGSVSASEDPLAEFGE